MPDPLRTAAEIRRHVVETSYRAGIGHVGSALSISDLLGALYGDVLRGEPGEPDRDRLILSKGHAALALYSALHATGRIGADELASYCADGSVLAGHPEHALEWVEFSTGSLGHGLSLGAGTALAARRTGSPARTYVLISDAECNAGSIWEAVMFAAHHGLSNLVALVDDNGQQALGHTRDVLDLSPLAERWSAFGWNAIEVDGTDAGAISETLAGLDHDGDRPHALIAKTMFGRGVSFMESKIEWHYRPLTEELRQAAIEELEAS